MRRLVLWDVDGTLVRGGVAARDALVLALARVLGHAVSADGIPMSGKTDPEILGDMLARVGVPPHERPAIIAGALEELASVFAALAERFAAEGRVLPGVPELLARLHERGDVLQTLLTGNIAANGRAKVAAFGLDGWLVPEIGAYGSDDADRTALVPIALARAARRTGTRWAGADVWVVGDTPRDLACARAAGVRCLLVATGRFSLAELVALDADAAFEDLSDTAAVEAILADGGGR